MEALIPLPPSPSITELTLVELSAMKRIDILNAIQRCNDPKAAAALKAVAENIIMACEAYQMLTFA